MNSKGGPTNASFTWFDNIDKICAASGGDDADPDFRNVQYPSNHMTVGVAPPVGSISYGHSFVEHPANAVDHEASHLG